MIELYDNQLKAIDQMKNGCILCGGVGSGKSRVGLMYYYHYELDGAYTILDSYINDTGNEVFKIDLKPPKQQRDLYIITTARKRDTKDWESEYEVFNLDPEHTHVDSWNNIKKYTDTTDAFFIFDEQRVVGYGAWTKAFLKITKQNRWILLSATPGDTWMDYIPVFIANGFYKNKTDFIRQHVIYNRYSKFPKVDKYVETGRLLKYRRSILINMKYNKKTVQHHIPITSAYDKVLYKQAIKDRWDIFKDEPVQDISGLCYLLRRITNSDINRQEDVKVIARTHPKLIIFYNFNYELDILRNLGEELGKPTAEWNGQKHEPIPETDEWLYLVQYAAGAEGWNCIETNAILFYSQNYSYKTMIQAAGRIDRFNTPYSDLYFYHVKSTASIDMAISSALNKKKNFQEKGFVV